jgi:pimeloyl-ACP methyl ester carboxylesterase
LAAELALDEVDERRLDPPAIDRLAEIHVPTRVLAGAEDVPAIRWLADRLAAEMPGAHRLPDVPDAAHLLPVERPDVVAAAVLDLTDGR